MQVVYLESYQRLREKGVVTNLQQYSPSEISNKGGLHLFMEINALLKLDPGIVQAMALIAEPSIAAYRYAQVLLC